MILDFLDKLFGTMKIKFIVSGISTHISGQSVDSFYEANYSGMFWMVMFMSKRLPADLSGGFTREFPRKKDNQESEGQ
jgi:hypothetical protein